MLMLLYAGRWLVRRLVWVSQNRGICSDILEITVKEKSWFIPYSIICLSVQHWYKSYKKCSTSNVLWYFSLLGSSWTVDSISLESVLSTQQSLFVHHRLNVCRSQLNSDLQLSPRESLILFHFCLLLLLHVWMYFQNVFSRICRV